MSFEDQYKLDVAAMLADDMPGVISISYTPKGGSAVVINALDGGGSGCDIRDSDTGEVLSRSRDIVILLDADSGVAAPAVDDIVTIDSLAWGVTAIRDKDAARATLEIVWARSESKHNENHKHKITS